jgi:methionyl-tRNA formyltransferase
VPDTLRLPERSLRLAFFGTPDIARVILERLLAAKSDEIVFVVCQPDRPKGRGKKVAPPPVKEAAVARGVEVLQPLKLRDGELAQKMKAANLDLAIVVAYGRILPEDVFAAPQFGTWNVHASLLPRHRGASPIQHAILQGDGETGVTLMQLSAGLDEGPMLLTRRLQLSGEETGGALTDTLAKLGGDLLIEGLIRAKKEGLTVLAQDGEKASYAPLLEKTHGEIDWTAPAEAIARRIRAFSPWPGAFVVQKDGQPLKIIRGRAVANRDGAMSPGSVVAAGDSLIVATGEGALQVLEVQPPGKRAMGIGEYLRGSGRHLQIGAPFPGR